MRGTGSDDRDRRRRLSVYLNDHAAIGVGGLELARRAESNYEGSPLGKHLSTLLPELERQHDALRRVMSDLGIRRNPGKTGGAWVGEKLGRAKLNGHLRSASPLSPVVEVEGLMAVLGAYLLLWRGLAGLHDREVDVDLAGLAEAAGEQLQGLESWRLELLQTAV